MKSALGAGPFALILDVETLGLPANNLMPVNQPAAWPRILEVAWQVVDGRGDVLRERSFLIRPPELDLDDEIQGKDIHGIDAYLLWEEGVPAHLPLAVLADDVRLFSPTFVAHNADFDACIIQAAYHREGMTDAVGNLPRICTMKAAAGKVGNRNGKWPKLDELIEDLFGVRREGTHRALADMRDTARAFDTLCDRGLVKLAVPERTLSFETDEKESAQRVQRAVERYMDDLHAFPTYYDPTDIESLGNEKFIRSVIRRMSRHYRPGVADYYLTPYDAVSNRMALSLCAEDEVAKYILVIFLEEATGVIPSAVRFTGDALKRAVAFRVARGLPVVTKLDVWQYYANVDHGQLVKAVQDLTNLASGSPFLDALRGSLAIPYRASEVKERRHGLSVGVPSEAYLAELFMERIEHDILESGVEILRVNDEIYLFSTDLKAARSDFTRVQKALWQWGLRVGQSKTRVKHYQPSYGDVEKYVVHQNIFDPSVGEYWKGYEVRPGIGMPGKDSEGKARHLHSSFDHSSTGLEEAVTYVNKLYDSLTESRLKAATQTHTWKAQIEEWYAQEGSIGVGSIHWMEQVLSFDRISHWINYDVLTPEALWGLVPLLHEYPRGEFHIARAVDVLVTAAVECVHLTKVPSSYRPFMTPDEETETSVYLLSTALAEAAHLANLALLNSEEIHPYIVYVLVRRMYKQADSLAFDQSRYAVKQIYDCGMMPAESWEDFKPVLPFAQDALSTLTRWQRRTHYLPLQRTLNCLLNNKSSAV